MRADGNHRVTSYSLDCAAKEGDYAGMDHLIISRELLVNIIKDYVSRGVYDLDRDFIQHEFNRGRLSINLYEVEDTVLRIRSVNEYFQSNLAIIDEKVGGLLFRGDRPIYTRITNEAPAHFGMDCQIEGCVVADGAILEGTTENCVISRSARIGKGAVIKNCVIMQGVVVGEGACLENVIVDKWVSISNNAQLKGLASNPVVIQNGVSV